MMDFDERAQRAGAAAREQARLVVGRMPHPAEARRSPSRGRLLAAATVTLLIAGAVGVHVTQDGTVPVVDGVSPEPAAPVAVDGVLPVPQDGEDVLAAYLEDGTPVFVAHAVDGEIVVVDAISPHDPYGNDKLVAYCPSNGWFEDMWHGSKFTAWGDWMGGPAPTGLPVYPSEVAPDGSTVKVTGTTPTAAERDQPRGERHEPRGPSCSDSSTSAYTVVAHRPPHPVAPVSGRDLPADRWTWVTVVIGGEPGRIVACDVDGTCPPDAPVVAAELNQPDGTLVDRTPAVYLARTLGDDTVELLRPARPDDRRAELPRPAVSEDPGLVRLSDDEVVVLAAAATDDPSLKGTVVPDSDGLASVWRMGTVAGTPPKVPDGHIAVLVFARQAQSTCRSVDDVLGVEIRDGLAVVVLDPDGEFLRPCPGPDGAAAWTAFTVAIPDRYADALTGAESRLADNDGAVRGGCQPVMSASVRGMTGTFPTAVEAARSVEELPDQGSLEAFEGDGEHAVFGWVVEDELRYVIDTVRDNDGWTVGSYERCQTGDEPPADERAWVDDDAKEAWDAENGPGTWVAGYFLPPDFAYDSFDEGQLVRRWLRTATGERDLDRAALLAASLAALPDAAPAGADNSWQPYPGSAERRLDLAAVHLDDDEVVLDFSELEATAPGTTAAMAMGLQFDTIVTHYYPEAASVCVLVDGEPSWWLHDMMTCPSRP